jgi:indole-3-glycerol phosphate synthase
MAASLDQIVAATRRRVSEARKNARNVEREAQRHAPRGFRRALQNSAQQGVAVIAELKKASPSRGLIRGDFEPGKLAAELAEAGAAALSVLTDEEFFQGSLENLRLASEAASLPCLRKDFIIDEFQLLEARANFADAVLLIVAALAASELNWLAQRSREAGLDVLCEVHDETELKQALDAGCGLIGVNSRDLRTLKVDLNTALRIGPLIPKNVLAVAESGIESSSDIARLRRQGYHAFLIGESLMKVPSPGTALRELLNAVPGTRDSVPSS